MVTKMAQICDQPKECEESGRKRLYMFGGHVTKLVTAPYRIDCVRLRQTKNIVRSLSHDIYSDRRKNNIIIKLSLCVIHVL